MVLPSFTVLFKYMFIDTHESEKVYTIGHERASSHIVKNWKFHLKA